MNELIFETPIIPNLVFLTDITSQKLYTSWLGQGHEGTEADFLEWLKVKGDKGENPIIGENGNWFIAGLDSGKPSKGLQGEPLLYSDLTIEQIAELQQPAIQAATLVTDAIAESEAATEQALQAAETANSAGVQLVDGAGSDYNTLKKLQDKLEPVEAHVTDNDKHVTTTDKANWNAKQETSSIALNTTDKNIIGAINEIRAIALNIDVAKVFDTKALMLAWLAIPENIGTLDVGTMLLIRAVSVPDFWWDGTQALELEVKIDLSNYYNKGEVDILLSGKSESNHNHTLSGLSEKSYNSLTDKPTIPTTLSGLSDVNLTETTPVDTDSILIQSGGTVKKSLMTTLKTFLGSFFQYKTLYFSNKSVLVTDFSVDATYSNYGYKADIACIGVTSTMYSVVAFGITESDSGNFASVCNSGTDKVTIYAKTIPSSTIIVLTIKSEKP